MKPDFDLFSQIAYWLGIAGTVIILGLFIALTFSGTPMAYNLTYNECIDIVNQTNETETICAPSYPTLNQTIVLGFSDMYRNDALNLSVVSPAENVCSNCTNTTIYIENSTCPILREIEWLITYNQTRIAENVSRITITGPPFPVPTICETCNYTNCTGNNTIYIQNCTNSTNSTCPQLKYGTFYLQPGESLNMTYFESIRTTCMACPAVPTCPDCIMSNFTCPAPPVCEVCKTCSNETVNFDVDGNCTVKTFDQRGQQICLDSRDKYCVFACQELRGLYIDTNASLARANADLSTTRTQLETEKRANSNMDGVATFATLIIAGIGGIYLVAKNVLPKNGVKQ